MEFAEGLEAELKLTEELPDVRNNRIEDLIRKVKKHKSAAIAEEMEWRRLMAQMCSDEEIRDEEKREQTKLRAVMIHRSRCNHIKAAAFCARQIVRYVAGDLRIDGSTAGTGLDTDERRLVAGVTGIGEDAW